MSTKGLGASPLVAYTLLILFSTAELLDIVNVTAPVIALPQIANDLNVPAAESQWVLNAYTLTFGAFLLIGGRFSAIYGPKALFIAGFATVGLGSLIDGFSVNGPMLFVIRALQGIGAAMTIPSAMTMIVLLFPDRAEQDRALGLFAGFGAVGNMGGLVIGGVISERIGWRWCFWIMAMVIIPLCVIVFFISPSPPRTRTPSEVYRNMDWAGLFLITSSTLLLVFALTEGNVKGWASKEVLPPLIISILLLPVFGYVETIAKEPLIPSWIWKVPTFTPLAFFTLCLYSFMNTFMFQMSEVFQRVWLLSPIQAAIRIIPFGLTALVATFMAGMIAARVNPRWALFAGQLLVLAGGVLLTFADDKSKYWRFVFPAFIIAPFGLTTGFVFANIAMLRAPLAQPNIDMMETTALIGALFNADLQIGSSIVIAIVTAITTKEGNSDPSSYAGYRAAWWFVVGLAGFEALLMLVCLREQPSAPQKVPGDETGECPTVSSNTEKSAEKVVV